MQLEFVDQIVRAIEQDVSVETRADVLTRLRALGLDDFGHVLWSMPDERLPKLSTLLPCMASSEVQNGWTGSNGIPLLTATSNYVRSLAFNYSYHTQKHIGASRVLDFGCGYGRIARLMYRLVNEDKLVGVDPWDESIRICEEDGIRNMMKSDYLPRTLPVSGKFDLIYAYSVFTHLSKRATLQCLATLRDYVEEDGLLAITIRPVEFWSHDPDGSTERFDEHRREGFTFVPHNYVPVEGDVTYGNTSLTTDWLARNAPQWQLVSEDRVLADPWQRYLFLRPA